MNYFKEYTEQLLALSRGEKTKIDVHFIVSEPLTSFCYNVNRQIGRHNAGFINMSVESIALPHISLFMGYVDNYEMLECAFCAVNTYAKGITPFSLDATKMYFTKIAPSDPHYLFIDLLQNDFLMQQKEIMNSRLENIVYPIDWNMKSERAHITVGCYRNLTPSVRELINSYNVIPTCRISQIGVSISGKRGVCLSLLKVFDLI